MTEHLAPPRGDGQDTPPIIDETVAADVAPPVAGSEEEIDPPATRMEPEESTETLAATDEAAVVVVETEGMPVEPESAPPGTESASAEPEPAVVVEPEVAVETGPAPFEAEPVPFETGPAPFEPESAPPETESASAEPEPAVVVEPELAVETGPAPFEPEPVPFEPQPAVETMPAPAGASAETAPSAEPAAPMTVGRYIAESLHAAGVRWAFTVPGESFLGLLDALGPAGIRVVATRHEGGAAFMAEAVSQLTGRPAVALGTRAVGAANLAIGIHTARADSTPLIALVGQVERPFTGREAFQEADLVHTIGGLAKWAAEPRDAAEVPRIVADAIRRATGDRPGPVVLGLPEDLLEEEMEAPALEPSHGLAAARPDPSVLHSILQLLAGAERPVILAGGGVLRARCSNDLAKLAELLRVPVIASWRRPDVMPNDHPLYLGMTGYGAPAVVLERLEAADAVLVLGARLSEVATFGYRVPHAGQRWAHVDLEPRAAVAGLPRPDLALACDARVFVRAALERLRGAVLDAATADARNARNAEDRAAWETAATVDGSAWDGPGVHPGRVVATLRRMLPDDAIVTTDAGNMAGWLARGFRFRRPGTFVGPTSGAMGYGLPAAIGAALVHRDRAVVAWTGDGGFAMTMNELETAVREKLRLVVLVLDNERFGTIRMHQDDRPGKAVGTDLGSIDFATVARGLGANGVRLASEDGFDAALRTALVSDRPTVIQLALDRRWVSVDRPAVE